MRSKKDIMVEIIRQKSQRETAQLAGEFARAASEEKEEILAAMEIERWLAEICSEALDNSEMLKQIVF